MLAMIGGNRQVCWRGIILFDRVPFLQTQSSITFVQRVSYDLLVLYGENEDLICKPAGYLYPLGAGPLV
jgi:hypothetical protein